MCNVTRVESRATFLMNKSLIHCNGMTKLELLHLADDLDNQAKDEEVGWVQLYDLQGRSKTFNRYALHYVAEGMRKEAKQMIG